METHLILQSLSLVRARTICSNSATLSIAVASLSLLELVFSSEEYSLIWSKRSVLIHHGEVSLCSTPGVIVYDHLYYPCDILCCLLQAGQLEKHYPWHYQASNSPSYTGVGSVTDVTTNLEKYFIIILTQNISNFSDIM